MAKKQEYLTDKIDKAYKDSRENLQKTVRKSIDNVYRNKDTRVVSAYERLQMALSEKMARGRITVGKLESIASQLRVAKDAGRREPEKAEKAAKKGKISTEEYYRRRDAGETYLDIKAKNPKQDIRYLEGAYVRYHLGKRHTETRPETRKNHKGNPVITGVEYRRLFQEHFHTSDPAKIAKLSTEEKQRFDKIITGMYDMPKGRDPADVLRAYRAHFHKSWDKK